MRVCTMHEYCPLTQTPSKNFTDWHLPSEWTKVRSAVSVTLTQTSKSFIFILFWLYTCCVTLGHLFSLISFFSSGNLYLLSCVSECQGHPPWVWTRSHLGGSNIGQKVGCCKIQQSWKILKMFIFYLFKDLEKYGLLYSCKCTIERWVRYFSWCSLHSFVPGGCTNGSTEKIH